MPDPVVATPPAQLAAQERTPSPQLAAGSQPNPPPKADGGGAPASKGSLYDDLGIDDPDKGGKPALWPDDWRNQFAGENKDLVKRFDRFDSPAALAKSYIALEQRIRSGEFKRSTPLPDGADEATVAKWREDNGLPTKADAYDIAPPGVDLEKMDANTKASISAFQETFLKAGVSKDQAKAVSNGIFQLAEQQIQAEAVATAQHIDKAEDTLRADWGPDYRTNLTMNRNQLTKAFGEDLSSMMLEAKLPNGMKLGNVPEFSKAVNQWARSNGGDILVGDGSSAAKTIDSRIAEIEGIMAKDMGQYTKAVADEYGKLLERREARKG
jgi:hypothetical protein